MVRAEASQAAVGLPPVQTVPPMAPPICGATGITAALAFTAAAMLVSSLLVLAASSRSARSSGSLSSLAAEWNTSSASSSALLRSVSVSATECGAEVDDKTVAVASWGRPNRPDRLSRPDRSDRCQVCCRSSWRAAYGHVP